MTLKQLRAVVAVHQHGSLQAAADELGLSRSTVGQLLGALEEGLGVKLLIRTPTGSSLTAPGEALVSGAEELLRAADGLRARITGGEGAQEPNVTIQLPVSLPELAHVMALTQITSRLPDARLDVQMFVEPEATYSEDVHLRLQFGSLPPTGPFRTFLLARIPVRLMATAGYLATHGEPASLGDLDAHRLLVWAPTGDGTRLPLLDGGHHEVRPALKTTDAPLLRTLASLDRGIAFAPCPEGGFVPPHQQFKELLLDQVGATAALRAVIPEKLADLSVTRAIIEVTRDLSMLYNAGELVWARES